MPPPLPKFILPIFFFFVLFIRIQWLSASQYTLGLLTRVSTTGRLAPKHAQVEKILGTLQSSTVNRGDLGAFGPTAASSCLTFEPCKIPR